MLWNHHNRALHTPIYICDIRDVRGGVVDNCCAIDVSHLRDIHCCTADVDAIHVSLAHVIRRHVHFSRTEREPSYVAAEASRTPADEDDQRRRIHGLHRDRTGDPTPASADAHPASVVERSITPRRVIDPRIAPRRNPRPVAGMVRSPANFNPVGKPNVAVLAVVTPVAVVIEIFVADYIVRKILCRTGIVVTMIAVVGPIVEGIRIVEVGHFGIELIGAAECSSLPAVQAKILAVAGGFALTFANADDRVITVGAGLHAIMSRLNNRECLVRGVDLEVIISAEPAYGDADGSRRKLNLNRLVVEIQKRKTSIGRHTDHGRSELNFGTRALIGPKLVSSGHRTVGNRSHPLRFSCWEE